MQAVYYAPPKPLSPFVGLFWYARGHEVPKSTERILPMGTVELVIKLGRGRTAEAVVSGPQSQSFMIERTTQDELLGIHFNPGGVFPFLEFPCDELHNLTVTLDAIWGEQRAAELVTRVHEAPSVTAKFQVLEKWLHLAASRPLRHHRAVAFAVQEFQRDPNLLRSAAIAERIGVSQRRFIEVFREEMGLTPKLFSRVQRFRDVIMTIGTRAAVDWPDLAFSYGYCDQAHFIHDFREFSGLTPGEYLGLRTANLGHVKAGD